MVVGQIVVVGGCGVVGNKAREGPSCRVLHTSVLGSPNRQRALQCIELQASFTNPRSMHGEPPTPCRSPPRMPQDVPENNPLKEWVVTALILRHATSCNTNTCLCGGVSKGVPFPDVLNRSKTSFVVMVVDQPVVPRCVCARVWYVFSCVGGGKSAQNPTFVQRGHRAKACGGHSHKGIECNMDTIEARGSVCAGSWCTNSSPTAQRTAHALTYVKWCVPVAL